MKVLKNMLNIVDIVDIVVEICYFHINMNLRALHVDSN